jgi:hypothetical protein
LFDLSLSIDWLLIFSRFSVLLEGGMWQGGQANYVLVPFADFNLLALPYKRELIYEKIADLSLLTDVLPTAYHGMACLLLVVLFCLRFPWSWSMFISPLFRFVHSGCLSADVKPGKTVLIFGGIVVFVLIFGVL